MSNGIKFREKPEGLSEEELYSEALRTSMGILQRRDNTEKMLREKLLLRGFEKDTIDRVMDYLYQKGYLNERRMLINAVGYMANSKLFGKSKILCELRAKGFSSAVISELDFSDPELEEIDFRANCIKLFIKRGGRRDTKTVNTLLRYGHSIDDIHAAIRYVESLTNFD